MGGDRGVSDQSKVEGFSAGDFPPSGARTSSAACLRHSARSVFYSAACLYSAGWLRAFPLDIRRLWEVPGGSHLAVL